MISLCCTAKLRDFGKYSKAPNQLVSYTKLFQMSPLKKDLETPNRSQRYAEQQIYFPLDSKETNCCMERTIWQQLVSGL